MINEPMRAVDFFPEIVNIDVPIVGQPYNRNSLSPGFLKTGSVGMSADRAETSLCAGLWTFACKNVLDFLGPLLVHSCR